MPRPALLLTFLALPTLASAGEESYVEPTVMLQLWGTAFDMDESPQADPVTYGDPEHDAGFSVRRARVGTVGGIGRLEFQVDLGVSAPYDGVQDDGSRPRIELANAFARSTWRLGDNKHSISAGLVKLPYGRERIMSSADLTFQERSVASEYMAPPQQVGLLWRLDAMDGLALEVGAYNGNRDLFGDDNMGLLLAGRASWETGPTYVTFGEAEGVDLGVGVAGYWNDGLATDTFSGEVDAVVRVSRLTVYVEGAIASIQPSNTSVALPDVVAKTSRFGATAQVSYWIPMDEASGADAAGRSGVEVAGRFSTYDDHVKLKDNGDVAIAHIGANWRNAVPGLDVGAGYVLRLETQGRSFPNDTVRLWAQVRWPKPGGKRWDPLAHGAGAGPADVGEEHPTGDR